jgi:2-polyprenyl-6-hydroxyphenyl methylase/3-demethylubiquinone-9 3-methyltransferase
MSQHGTGIVTSIDATEIERFDRLSRVWWDTRGPMRPLHVVNDLRLEYVLARIATAFGREAPVAVRGLRILDVGCGAGLLCEPLARAGAVVTGIDAAPRNVEIARRHADDQQLEIDYRAGEPACALDADERFDAILALEVVEHVPDPGRFVRDLAGRLAGNGPLIVSTINRTWRSFVIAILGAEYVFRVLPRGTHRWRAFVRPEEVEHAAASAGLATLDSRGMRYLPVLHRAGWTRSRAVNYVSTFSRVASGT